jgi:hypothetical protein
MFAQATQVIIPIIVFFFKINCDKAHNMLIII